jgi:cytochrome P450
MFAAGPDMMQGGKANVVLRPFLGSSSLILLDGDEHQRQRRLLMPPFHGERMQAYGKLMIDIAHASLDTWPVGRAFRFHRPMQSITMDIILRAVFGFDEGARMQRLHALLTKRLGMAAWPPLMLPAMQKDLGPLSPWGRFVRIGLQVDEILNEQIRDRRRAAGPERTDVLSLLVNARDEQGQEMSEQELRDELVTLLVAGHETTASALAWAMRWVLANPELEERLRAEIATAAPYGELLPDRVGKLELLDATVRETLRLQPVVPMVGRILERPARIGGYDLPAGAALLASIYLVQRRPELYPEPERFDPDRFLRTKPAPYEWFPFGGGIRRCIGMAFAVYEMKMVLATVLSRAWLRLENPDIRVVRRSITLTPQGGLPVVVTGRLPKPMARAEDAA